MRTHQPTVQQNSPVPLIMRKSCSCGRPMGPSGECAECQRKRLGVQAKLRVNRPGDRYEREADRIAIQVMNRSKPDTVTPIRSSFVQRSKVNGLNSIKDTSTIEQPSNGQPLPNHTRKFFESRFGHDFSQVRVYTDAQANMNAQSIGANAYTVGQNIIFNSQQFSPNTTKGRNLIAHELVHVLQQKQGQPMVQRWAKCKPTRMALPGGNQGDCLSRKKGEKQRARSTPMVFDPSLSVQDLTSGTEGYLIINFDIGESKIKQNLHETLYWNQFLEKIEANRSRWKLVGFTDCPGDKGRNQGLRKKRAKAVFDILPKSIQAQITSVEAAPIDACITENNNEAERTMNRSVAIIFESYADQIFEGEDVEGDSPEFVCGPDVTEQLSDAVTMIRTTFGGFNQGQKEEACNALISTELGYVAWDIIDLCDKCEKGNGWILDWNPPCATQNTEHKCGASVQIGDECFFSGSANYITWGVMFKLCSTIDSRKFNLSEAKSWIWFYKTHGGLKSASRNLNSATEWATAGYKGWSKNVAPPKGDRPNCEPKCPYPYNGPAFDLRWCPIVDPRGECIPRSFSEQAIDVILEKISF